MEQASLPGLGGFLARVGVACGNKFSQRHKPNFRVLLSAGRMPQQKKKIICVFEPNFLFDIRKMFPDCLLVTVRRPENPKFCYGMWCYGKLGLTFPSMDFATRCLVGLGSAFRACHRASNS